ncbi:MAG: RagB/SusD family nutrient uptake outer membrane protein [Bacteroidota bacterium]
MKSYLTLPLFFIIGILLVSCRIESEGTEGQDLVLREIAKFEANPDSIADNYLESSYDIFYDLFAINNIWLLQELSSDIITPLSLGPSWDDNSVWEEISLHTWGTDNFQVVQSWDRLNESKVDLFNSRLVFDQATSTDEIDAIIAERDMLLAYADWMLIDLFRQTIDVDEKGQSTIRKKGEAVQYAIEKLEAALPKASGKERFTDQKVLTRLNKWSGMGMLARLYLNRAVYDGSFNFQASDMERVVELCDDIIQSGVFKLATSYWDVFKKDNGSSPSTPTELLFGSKLKENGGFTNSMLIFTLNSAHFPNNSSWNGFTNLAEFYQAWDQDDPRFEGPRIDGLKAHFGINAGLQTTDSGDTLRDSNGMPVIYDSERSGLGPAILQGSRSVKYEPDFATVAASPFSGKNLFAYLRLGEIYLMKAEAEFRLGLGSALSSLNLLRSARGASELSTISEQAVLDEYGFELWLEGQRRTHLVRFGKFNEAVSTRPNGSQVNKAIYPIPLHALANFPELEQNEGY